MDFCLEIQPIKYKLSFAPLVASWWLRQTMVAAENEGSRTPLYQGTPFATLRRDLFNENKNRQLLENVDSKNIIWAPVIAT